MAEKRPDMFDVASGECELVDFLLTRFDPIDLKTKIRFDPNAEVNEQVAPPKEPEPAELPSAPAREAEPIGLELTLGRPLPSGEPAPTAPDPGDGYRPAAAVQEADGQDQLHEAPPPPEEEQAPRHHPPMTGAAKGPDWLTLIQGFHEAAQRYQEVIAPEPPPEDETP